MGGETVCEAFPRSCVSHCQVGMLYGAWQDIVGTLPAEVAGCAQMASIDLSNNLLSGTIPPEWGQLLEVFDVDLSSNLISGSFARLAPGALPSPPSSAQAPHSVSHLLHRHAAPRVDHPAKHGAAEVERKSAEWHDPRAAYACQPSVGAVPTQ